MVPATSVPTGTPGTGASRLVHTVDIALAQPYPALGVPTTIPMTVTAKDLSGNVIAAPDVYSNPITVTDEDTSGHTSLTRTVLNAPSDIIALRYDGSYFPPRGLHADWADPTGVTIEPFRQIATGIPTNEWSLGAGHIAVSVTRGGDGAIWFADYGAGAIGRSAAAGIASFYPLGSGWQPLTVAAGPDRVVWFVAGGAFNAVGPYPGVGRIGLDGSLGSIWPTSYSYGRDLVVASDGVAFMNQLNRVTRITPAGMMTNIPFTYSDGNTVHTNTLVVGADGALYATSTGTLFRYDRSSGTQTSSPFPINAGGRAIDPAVMIAAADGSLYFDDLGSSLYRQSIPTGTVVLIGRGSATPQQGDALSPTSLALARDGTLWFSSFQTSLDGQPFFGHVVGGAVQMLVGQSKVAAKNSNFQDVPASSIVLGADGRLWYSRSDSLGSFAP